MLQFAISSQEIPFLSMETCNLSGTYLYFFALAHLAALFQHYIIEQDLNPRLRLHRVSQLLILGSSLPQYAICNTENDMSLLEDLIP
jgi:hypothetical protein